MGFAEVQGVTQAWCEHHNQGTTQKFGKNRRNSHRLAETNFKTKKKPFYQFLFRVGISDNPPSDLQQPSLIASSTALQNPQSAPISLAASRHKTMITAWIEEFLSRCMPGIFIS
ncbi:MAG: hypothetical protein ACSHYF_11315 [Verrucomicrobiaceae bacterium]